MNSSVSVVEKQTEQFQLHSTSSFYLLLVGHLKLIVSVLDQSNFRSEIDLSETELPDKDLKILELLVKRFICKHIKVLYSIFNFLEDRRPFKMRRTIFIRNSSGSGRRKLKKPIRMLSRRRDERSWPRRGTRSERSSTAAWRRRNKSFSLLKITWRKFYRTITRRGELLSKRPPRPQQK